MSDDIIRIDNGESKIQKPFKTAKKSPLFHNITLLGSNGQPIIQGQNPILYSHLFGDKAELLSPRTVKNYTIHIINIWFTRVGIVSLKDKAASLVVHITNCTVSDLMHNDTSIIYSAATNTIVMIRNSLLYDFSKGIKLTSSHVKIAVESSKVLVEKESFPGRQCPQLMVVDDIYLWWHTLSRRTSRESSLLN